MNVDKNPAYPAGVEALKAEVRCRIVFACANAST
jgi:hypothetical protein